MKPIELFESAWARCDELHALHNYLSISLTSALQPDELLRSEWVGRVSALDLYVHELVLQKLLRIFDSNGNYAQGFSKMQFSGNSLVRIAAANNSLEARQAFELEIKTKLGYLSFQFPDKIADAVRFVSDIPLWVEVASIVYPGAPNAEKNEKVKSIKTKLSLIVERRNKIAHEADFQSATPRQTYPISAVDVTEVKVFINSVVRAIDQLVWH